MPILEQRGIFWWHDESIPDRQFAPDSGVPGLCKIEDTGQAILELDGYLPNKYGPMAAMSGAPVSKSIQGILKGTGERILLSDLIRDGGRFSSNAMSFEPFVATHCLVGNVTFTSQQGPEFDTLEIPLAGFEAWLRFGAIKASHADGKLSATYEAPGDIVYSFDSGSIKINFDVSLDCSGMLGIYAFSLKQTASLTIHLNHALRLTELNAQYLMFEDLMKLLTGSDYSLEWPLVCFQNNSKCRWYFRRLRSNEPLKDIDYHNTITNFVELRDQFGSIWSKWVAKRAELGPGIYLYLGTRRGMPLYEEHRFVNLIWGVEAFHREKTRLWRSDALKEKIDRIVGQVALETDKKWLRERLKHAHEPPLEQRIFEVFKTLPIGLDEGRLRAFSKACAKLRNDISHFGGDRHRESYLEFIRDLDRKSDALSILYHALLLHEVEIDATILSRWINDSFGSYAIKMHFAQAGLLDQNMLGDNPL